MRRYKNLSGNSGVTAYECAPESIEVQFTDGWIYRYTTDSAGAKRIADMQRLAKLGRGLSSYIAREVGDRYEERFR